MAGLLLLHHSYYSKFELVFVAEQLEADFDIIYCFIDFSSLLDPLSINNKKSYVISSSRSDAVHCGGHLVAGLGATQVPPPPQVTTMTRPSHDVTTTRHHHSLKSSLDCVYCRSDVTMTSWGHHGEWSVPAGGGAITSEPATRRASYLVTSLRRDGTATSGSVSNTSRLYPYDDGVTSEMTYNEDNKRLQMALMSVDFNA